MPARPPLAALALLAAVGSLVAGCGDADDGNAAASLCEGIVALDGLDVPGGAEPPTAEEAQAFGAAISPLVDDIRSGLDGRLADEAATLERVASALAGGDPSALAPSGPADPVAAALAAIRADAAETCGFEQVAVSATEYRFELPATVDAGGVVANLANVGSEPHVLLLVRRTQDTDEPAGEAVGRYLASFETGQPADGLDDVAGGGPFALPGSAGSHLWDLQPGSYLYFCPIPSGPDGSGPPHFLQGMLGELEVEA